MHPGRLTALMSSSADTPELLTGVALDAHLRRRVRSLRPGEHNAVAYYVDLGSLVINAALRRPDRPAGATARHITLLDSAIKTQRPLERSAVVWRGIRSDDVAQRLASASVGDFLTEAAFTSTSTDRGLARVFAERGMVKILLPPGLRVLYVPATTVSTQEREVILPRNMVYEVRRIADNEIEVVAHELA